MSGVPRDAWLVVIDMQVLFSDPSSPWAAPRFAETVAPIGSLVTQFEDRSVFTRFVAPTHPQGAWNAYFDEWPFARQHPDAPAYALVEPFARTCGVTVDAATFGKWGPELARRVGSASRLVLCGVSTDCCVLSTALAAADAGMEVTVVADACAGASDETHHRALQVMALYGPLVHVRDARTIGEATTWT